MPIHTDEHMRYPSGPQYRLDGGNAASLAQARIDDHQVRLVMGGGNHGLTLGCHRRADLVAHTREQFAKQQGYKGVIFGYEHLEGFHASKCARISPERKRNPDF